MATPFSTRAFVSAASSAVAKPAHAKLRINVINNAKNFLMISLSNLLRFENLPPVSGMKFIA
jgi:hypothetical protein